MFRRVLKVVGVTFACLLAALVAFVVIALQFASGSAGGTLESGRSVMTYADSWYLGTEFQGDTATIRTAGHTIVVAPTQLSVDGKMLATMDKSIAAVDVTVRDGEIWFVADGTEVARCRR